MTDEREGRLLSAAGLFLFLYALVLTLAPAVREHTWAVTYRTSHWSGFALWAIGIFSAHRVARHRWPDRDPFLFPMAAILSGWGLLTVWRLEPGLGLRQTIWLLVSLAAFAALAYTPADLGFLRRYKYILLGGGLFLTALTLLFGTNPAGAGPRLWLGCCGIYLQPSEPLKLLLIVYLSAYLADRLPLRLRFFPMIVPTILVTGLALLLLLAQRDLGTASIFILLYTAVLFLATNRRRVLLATTLALVLAGLTGFMFIDVVHARLEAWLNPWSDPSGRSYQVIQSLLAVANGGVFGRGPGIGSPGLVPVAHSDFVFSAISEEAGLAGAIALLVLVSLMFARGMLASIRAHDRFQRLLAVGLTVYLGMQALVIIGGNLRVLPLTGVTLPFVSYGGSSLLTSFLALGFVMAISNRPREEATPLPSMRPYYIIGAVLGIGVLSVGLAATWWAVARGPSLLRRTDNPRRAIADRYVPRGSILDRNNQLIDHTSGASGEFQRVYSYPPLAPITGYTHPVFGQAGLEAALDPYLRGLQGNPSSLVLADSVLYGTPPPGLDVRLSIDLDLQRQADELLGGYKGAVVLLNAQTGEVLAMASHPGYDPNRLDEIGSLLPKNSDAPLLNRAAQGLYPIGSAGEAFSAATPQAGSDDLLALYRRLGFFTTPELRMPVAAAGSSNDIRDLRVSPLQMAEAAAALSNGGVRPAARIALAVKTPTQGWVILPALGTNETALSQQDAEAATSELAAPNQWYWQSGGKAQTGTQTDTWYTGGTLPEWKATPIAVAVLIEGDFPLAAQRVGQQLLQSLTRP